jgi:MYXO-CTERM domain-containing protein
MLRVFAFEVGLSMLGTAVPCSVTLAVLLACGCTARPLAEPEDVIVSFREGSRTLAALRDQPDSRPGLQVSRAFRHVPALAVRATPEALLTLERDPEVLHVRRDARGQGQLKEAVPAIGGDRVKSVLGLSGKGVTVAVLDTGIVTKHPDLSDAVVAQHCFTQRACPPAFAAEGTSAEDDHGHGSNVTGVIASNGTVSSPGFAPDVEVVAVKINDSNDSGNESDWVAGLDWVYDNLSTLDVKIVNLSIATIATHSTQADCDRSHPALAQAVKNLTSAGVSVFVSSGNAGLANALPAPACLSGDAIVVGATYDSALGMQPEGYPTYGARWSGFGRCADATTAFDQVACFSNGGKRVDILAPGAQILSDALRNGTEKYVGTSQASGVAAGVAALMLQCNPALTPAEVKRHMQASGPEVTDSKNGLAVPSLRAYEAVLAACPELADGLTGATPDAGTDEPGPSADAGGGRGPTSRDAGALATSDAGPRATRDAAAKPGDGEEDEPAEDAPEDGEQAPRAGNGSGEQPSSVRDDAPEGCNASASASGPLGWFPLLGLTLLAIRRRRHGRASD